MIIEFETAKLAKEVGFDNDSKNYYESTGELNGMSGEEMFDAPTQAELQTWLREEHEIVAQAVMPNDACSTGVVDYEIELIVLSENRRSTKNIYGRDMIFPTWEEALEAGLVAGLKLINDEK